MGDLRSPISSREMNAFERIYERYSHATMVSREAYIANLHLAAQVLGNDALSDGAIVECGTWRGGMAAGLIEIGGGERDYWFFDSFKGLPPPGAEDGDEAREWAANKSGERYFNNCAASVQEFVSTLSTVRISEKRIHTMEGWFSDTLPKAKRVGKIAVLRLDADWFASTMLCLNAFWDEVDTGGLVLIDDYYDWVGCRRAVHAFLAQRLESAPIRQSAFGGVCYLLKP